MEPQVFFNAMIVLASLIGGILLKSILDAVKELRSADSTLHDRVTKMASDLPNTYVRRDDFIGWSRDVKELLVRIETKLDGKQDKVSSGH